MRTFTATVYGDTATELEDAARKQAAEFFGTSDLHVLDYAAQKAVGPDKYMAKISLTDQAPLSATLDYVFGDDGILPCASSQPPAGDRPLDLG